MNIVKRIVRIFSYLFVAVAIFGLVLCCMHSDDLIVKNYAFADNKVNSSFHIAVLSDYHHRELKFPNADLVEEVKKTKPDIIVFCGDMIDAHTKSLNDVCNIMDGLSDYPIYYVTGNHEEYAPLYEEFKQEIEKRKHHVFFIDDKKVELNNNVTLYGLHDPRFDTHTFSHTHKDYGRLEETLNKFTFNNNRYNILLAHRPELMDLYQRYPFDMVISGHSHGGQIIFGGFSIYKMFLHTEYNAGEYLVDNKRLYVSAGLGYAAMMPLRINCNPEILNININ